MVAKEEILKIVGSLSDDVSIDDAIERLYLLAKVEKGIQQADAGNVINHSDVKIRFNVSEN